MWNKLQWNLKKKILGCVVVGCVCAGGGGGFSCKTKAGLAKKV